MSAGGGATNALVIGPVKKLVIVFAVAVFLIGPSQTAGFAKSLITAIGYGIGFVIGGIPTAVHAITDGQHKMGGSSAKVTSPQLGGPASSAPANPAAPKANTPPDPSGNNAGKSSTRGGTDSTTKH